MMAMTHLIAAPILLPLLTAAIMLMLGERHRPLKAKINLFSSLVGLFISVLLLHWTQTTGCPAPSEFTCRATGRRRSALCWWLIACQR